MGAGPGSDQGQPPMDLLIASGIFEGSHRAVPVAPYLGARMPSLKGLTLQVGGDIFQPGRQRLQRRSVPVGCGGSQRRARLVQLVRQQ